MSQLLWGCVQPATSCARVPVRGGPLGRWLRPRELHLGRGARLSPRDGVCPCRLALHPLHAAWGAARGGPRAPCWPRWRLHGTVTAEKPVSENRGLGSCPWVRGRLWGPRQGSQPGQDSDIVRGGGPVLPARRSPESWVETQREAAAPSGARAVLALPTASRAGRRGDGAAESIRGESVSELPAAARSGQPA